MVKNKFGTCGFLLLIVICLLFTSCSGEVKEPRTIRSLYDYVLDVGTYTSLDWEWAKSMEEEALNQMSCGCSGVTRQNSEGITLVGRNFDFYANHKPLFIFRTDVEGCYRTIGVSTVLNDGPDYSECLEKGISEDLAAIIPFITVDSLNEKGLYIETNMRFGQPDEEGNVMFSSSGTGGDTEERMSLQYITLYLTLNCATVPEALELVGKTNIYLPDSYDHMNICFMLSDAYGNYGVLEIADNKVYWNEKQPVQTNFYINEDCYKRSDYKSGLGRYEYLMEGVKTVESEADMFSLMDGVKYSGIYNSDVKYDVRTEYVGSYPEWTDSYVLDEAHRDEVMDLIQMDGDYFMSMTLQELRDNGEYWWSTMTSVVNCNERTISIRFFEDDDCTLTLGFED